MMKRLNAAVLALGVLALPAIAAVKTVTLAVENMTCVSCPYIVKESLAAVQGVSAVEVSIESQTATVTFDDEKADIDALIKATTDAGYPSSPKS